MWPKIVNYVWVAMGAYLGEYGVAGVEYMHAIRSSLLFFQSPDPSSWYFTCIRINKFAAWIQWGLPLGEVGTLSSVIILWPMLVALHWASKLCCTCIYYVGFPLPLLLIQQPATLPLFLCWQRSFKFHTQVQCRCLRTTLNVELNNNIIYFYTTY